MLQGLENLRDEFSDLGAKSLEIELQSTQQEYVALVAGQRSIAPDPDARQEQERQA